MITYLTQLTICWTILFAVYYLFLKRETFFAYNRWFLLAGLTLGLIIPLIDWTVLIIHETESFGHIYVTPVQTQVHQIDLYVASSEQTPWWYLLLMGIYGTGLLVTSVKLTNGIREIISLRQGAEITQQTGYELVLTQQLHMPFSFMKSVYWSDELYRKAEEKDRILAHEAKHVSALHSLDILFIEILCVLFWFHPMVYIYRKEIKEVHEYEADAAACILGSRKAYGQLLINQANSGLQLALANHFFYSQLKNRFKMMTRKPSARTAKLKYLIAIPIIGLAILVFSFVNKDIMAQQDPIMQTDNIYPTSTMEIQVKDTSNSASIDQKHEIINDPSRRAMIAKFKPIKTIWGNKRMEMTYSRDQSPDYSSNKEPQETAIIHYTLKKDGSVSKPKLIFSTTERVGKEALAIIKQPQNMGEEQINDFREGNKVSMKLAVYGGGWIDGKINHTEKRTYPDQNYLELLTDYTEKIFLVIDEEVIGEIKSKKISRHIRHEQIYMISNSIDGKLSKKYKVNKNVPVIDIKTRMWADKNPDKIRRGNKTVVGKVIDMEGHPAPGVSVIIKGSRTGTATDIDGNYRLSGVDMNDELTFISKEGLFIRELPVNSHYHYSSIVQFPTVKLHNTPLAVEEVYEGNVVDALPRFPGCEKVDGTEKEKIQCAEKKFLTYLYENIRYPKVARNNIVQGQVIVSFVVKKDGSIDHVHILRDLGAGLGEEVEQLLKNMNKQGKWTPAMKDGKPFNFQMTLPVTFKLKGDNVPSDIRKANMDQAVNLLSEIVVIGYADPSAKSHLPFDVNDEIQKAMEEGTMKSISELNLVGYGSDSSNMDKVKGVKKENNKTHSDNSDNSLSEVVVTGSGTKINTVNTDEKQPLIVLDGYIIGRAHANEELKYVDPSNIESISVLKGVKAIEEYGDQGKSGVIIITTKKPVLKPTDAKLVLSDFILYPNPASSELTVDFSGPNGDYTIVVVDGKGATQLSKEINNTDHVKTVLNIADLNSGVYYLLIKSNSKVTAKVFVKE